MKFMDKSKINHIRNLLLSLGIAAGLTIMELFLLPEIFSGFEAFIAYLMGALVGVYLFDIFEE